MIFAALFLLLLVVSERYRPLNPLLLFSLKESGFLYLVCGRAFLSYERRGGGGGGCSEGQVLIEWFIGSLFYCNSRIMFNNIASIYNYIKTCFILRMSSLGCNLSDSSSHSFKPWSLYLGRVK